VLTAATAAAWLLVALLVPVSLARYAIRLKITFRWIPWPAAVLASIVTAAVATGWLLWATTVPPSDIGIGLGVAIVVMIAPLLSSLACRGFAAGMWRYKNSRFPVDEVINDLASLLILLHDRRTDRGRGSAAAERTRFSRDAEFRRQMVQTLEYMTGVITGPWTRAMSAGSRRAAASVRGQAQAIVAAIEYWERRIVLADATYLDDLARVLPQALGDAIDGHWEALAAPGGGTSAPGRFQRLAAAVRQLMVILLPLAFAALVLAGVIPLGPALTPPVIFACVTLPATQLLTMLNPKSADLINSVVDLGSFFKGGV
jgi:hypothetical protein